MTHEVVFLLDVDNTLLDNDRSAPISSATCRTRSARSDRRATGPYSSSSGMSSATPIIWALCSAIAWSIRAIRTCSRGRA
jgi:hypothetical protein